MRREDWLPVLVAGGAACAVVYIAYNQAVNAIKVNEDDQGHPAASTSSHASSKEASAGSRISTSCSTFAGTLASSDTASVQDTDVQDTNAMHTNGSALQRCDFCHKDPGKQELLLRCSRCRKARYCSRTCQKQAWPQHKHDCKRLPSQPGSSACSSNSSSTTTSPTAQHGASRCSINGSKRASFAGSSSESSSASDSVKMMDVLQTYLQQHSSSHDDPLQQQFEQAVLLFVRREHRTAIAQLQAVKQAAEQQCRHSLAGDACKWMGHAYSKLGDASKAAASFASGCELAKKAGNKKLQVDCLSGMGAVYRDSNQLAAAEGFLRQAQRVADSLGDDVVRAGCLTQLGTVLIASDAEVAIEHLQEAVQLREDQVVHLHDEGQRGSTLATAIMEHAGSLVSLAGAYYCHQRYNDAADAYSKSLTVFDMIDDVDKVCKCLINLANLYELQIQEPNSRKAAAEHRRQLYQKLSLQLGQTVPETCSICCEPIRPLQPTTADEQKLLLLGCLHCFHHHCWETWSEKQAACPSCKHPMPLTTQR